MECVEMDLRTVDSYLNHKLDENSDFILLTFYELRIKLDLSKADTNLSLIHIYIWLIPYMQFAIICFYDKVQEINA